LLTLRDVNNHPEGPGALEELGKIYDISETASGLLLIQRDADLRLYLYELDTVLAAARRNAAWNRDQRDAAAQPSPSRYGPEDIISGAADLTSARRAIVQLEEQIAQLRATGKAIVEQREQWKLRALLAEEKLNKLPDAQPDPGDQRYSTLRRFLAKRFHPDHAPGTGIEKLIRSEIFKEIWGEVGRIEGR
jgi:hypothetical protein